MQERVTYEAFYIKKKSGKNHVSRAVVFVSVFLVFVLFLLVCFVQNFTKKNDDIFSKKTIYYISLENTKNQNSVEQMKKKIQSVGGAGFVLKDENCFHVLAYAYEEKTTAQAISEQLSSEFNVEIIEKTMPKVSRKIKKQIKSELLFMEIFKFVCKENQNLSKNISAHQKGELSNAKMFQILKKTELEIDTLKNNLNTKHFENNAEKIKNQFLISLESAKSVFQSMSEEIYKSGDLSVSFKSGLILFYELNAVLRENLNKIT